MRIGRVHIENTIYRLFKAAILLAVLAMFDFVRGRFGLAQSPITILSLFLLVRVLISLRIPTGELKPILYKRAEVKRFFKKEILFGVTISGLVFLFHVGSSPELLTQFLIVNFVLQTALYALWSTYNKLIVRPQNLKSGDSSEQTALIIGTGERGKNAADVFMKHPDLNTRVIGFLDFHKVGLWRYRDIPLIGKVDEVEDIILSNHVDYVIMAIEADDYVASREVFRRIEETGTRIIILPCIYKQKISKCYTSSLNGTPVLLYQSGPSCRTRLLTKEVMDRLGGLVGMVLSAPIMALAAIAIRLESKGPIFFRQDRSGINGRTFKMIKLRTMIADAEQLKDKLKHLNEMSGPVFKIKEDPRITRVGKILRKLSIDELPQFYNVFKGDMSLVGPRPPLPREVKKFKPWQRRKLSVKPGLTCIWQVSGRNQVDFDDWMRQDLEYIDNWSLKKDAEILVKTIPAVIKTRGAC